MIYFRIFHRRRANDPEKRTCRADAAGGQFPVAAITGPRSRGKSTLAKAAFPDKRCVSFDDRTLRELAKSNPGDFLKAFPDGVIIDEAQKVPEIFDAVKLLVDKGPYEPGKYIFTGSSQLRLKQNKDDLQAPHPALIGGKDPQVQMAGIVHIHGGKIASYDNQSGHYKPNAKSMSVADEAFGKLPQTLFKKKKG